MTGGEAGGIRWKAVSLGWLAAFAAGFAASPLARAAYGFFAESPVRREEFSLAMVIVSLLAGFLAYLIGGYVAARKARASGGVHGAMTAVFGLLAGAALAVVLALFGTVFPEVVALPPAAFGLSGAALPAGALLFFVNLFGGFVGGKLGEPSPKAPRHP